jgi:hypothetical protein
MKKRNAVIVGLYLTVIPAEFVLVGRIVSTPPGQSFWAPEEQARLASPPTWWERIWGNRPIIRTKRANAMSTTGSM